LRGREGGREGERLFEVEGLDESTKTELVLNGAI